MSAEYERSRSNLSDSAARYAAALRSTIGTSERVLWIGTRVPLATGADVVPIDTTADPADLESAAAPFDTIVCNLLAPDVLARWLPVAKKVLAPAGRLIVGCAHEGSTAHALSTLTVARPASRSGGGSVPMLIATLAASGYVVESGSTVAASADAAGFATHDLQMLLARSGEASVDYYVVVGRGADAEDAAERGRRQLEHGRERRAPSVGTAEALAQAALLRREQQLAVLEGSLGWRLLSHYGPYKRRFVIPVWRSVQAASRRWLRSSATPGPSPYEAWTRFADRVHHASATALGGTRDSTVVSVVMTVGDVPLAAVQRSVAALLAQDHQRWQLLIGAVGDLGAATVRGLQASDARIAIDARPFATATEAANAALAGAHGGLVGFCTAVVVELAPDALASAIRAMADADGDVLYVDDDAVDDAGRRHAPRLKPGWSPDLLLSTFYWSGFVLYRRDFLSRLGALRSEYDGAHHYDLALRATEQRARIVHLPRVLAHVGTVGTAAGPAVALATQEAGRRALAASLARRGIPGEVAWHEAGHVYRVRRAIDRHGKVTIIVPTRDGLAMLQRCLRAVEATHHPSFEVVIVDNGSVEPATLAFLGATRHTVIRAPGPFNFSRLNNLAVAETTGDHLVFLNDDTEALSPDWLLALEEHAQRPEVGAVGAKLLYPDGRIQHAGIAVGIAGLAGHPYRFQRDAPEAIRDVSAVTAACLMMRREAFDAVGGFDERLPVNSNDVDLCLRLRAHGYLIVYTPHAVLTHYESATRGARATPDDAWLMTRRWSSELAADPYYSPNADRREETGGMDLSKPDGMVSLYAGAERRRAPLRVPPGQSVGQRFFATAAHLCAVVVRLADGAAPPAMLLLRLRADPEAVTDVRVVETAVGGRTPDERWFCFEPLPDSADRFWYFVVENGGDRDVTLMRTPIVSDVMGPCFEGGRPSHGTLLFELYARAPWRCATSPP